MKYFSILIITLLIHFVAFSQKVLQERKYTSITKDNAENNYGAYASVTIDYMVRSIGKDEVYIATSVSDFVINANQGYGYNGKVYHNEVPGLVQALESARASSPTITFRIYYAGLVVATRTASVTAINNLNAFSGDGFSIPATEEQIKNPNWTLEAIELKSFSINPDGYIYTGIISKYLKLLEDKNAYKKQISIAEKALSAAVTESELLNAKAEFSRAASISPEENYPSQKIESINEKIADLRKEEKRKIEEEKQKQEEDRIKQVEEAKKKKDEEDGSNRLKEKEDEEVDKKSVKKQEKVLTEDEKEANNRRFSAAGKLEADGDELANSNPSLAKQKYEEAQMINYTNRVEQKIKNLKTNLQVQAGMQAIMGVDQLAQDIDPEGKTRFSELFSGYDGFVSDFEKLDQNYPSKPWHLHFFGLRFSALFLALELRMGYHNSPYYKFDVEKNNEPGKVIDNVAIQQQAITVGLSGGLNFRVKRFAVYGLYGAEWLGLTTSKTMQENTPYRFYADAASPSFPNILFVMSGGIDYNIPKTRLGIGLRYNIYKTQIKSKNGYVEIKGGADDRYLYYMNKISPDKIDYSNFGARLIWDWN